MASSTIKNKITVTIDFKNINTGVRWQEEGAKKTDIWSRY